MVVFHETHVKIKVSLVLLESMVNNGLSGCTTAGAYSGEGRELYL